MPDHKQDPTHANDAGRPANHSDQQPSEAELDERDRRKTGPRRAAGPPLDDGAPGVASMAAPPGALPPATDPREH